MKLRAGFIVVTCYALVSFVTALYAQKFATLRGFVIDAESNKPLFPANVLLSRTTFGAATNEEGFYVIEKVPPGRYLVEVSMLGYKNQLRGVFIEEGDTVRLNFGLIAEVYELETITVESEKIDVLKEFNPPVRIEARDIHKSAPTATADVLKEVAGVSVARSGGWGSKPYIQGMTDSRILVFLDGVKTNQACPMGMDACTATIEPDAIENMEVKVGPATAQYGSGNMGGVIHISSLTSQYASGLDFKTGISFLSRYQSVSNSRTGLFTINGGNSRFDFIADMSAAIHEDYNTSSGKIANSGFQSSTIHLKTRYRPSVNQQLLFTSQIYRGKDIGWPAANTIIPDEKRQTYALNYSWQNISSRLQTLQLNASYQPMYHNMENYTGDTLRFIGESRSNTMNMNLTTQWAIGKSNTLSAGIFYSMWDMKANRTVSGDGTEPLLLDIIPKSTLNEAAIFADNELRITEQLKLQAGLRINHIRSKARETPGSDLFTRNLNSTETISSGSAALLYNFFENTALNISISKGFRAATPVERYIAAPMTDGFYRIGNPQLTSETNLSKRLGIRGITSRLNWSMEIYHNQLSNLIAAQVLPDIPSPYPGLNGVKKFHSILNATVTGGIASIEFPLFTGFSLQTSLSYDYGQIEPNNAPLPGIAPFHTFTKLIYENVPKNYWLELGMDVAAGQNRYSGQYGEKATPGYAVFNIRGGWKLGDALELTAGVENITDAYYRNHLNLAFLPEPGRNAHVGLKVALPLVTFKNQSIYKGNTKEVKLSIEGMDCDYCVRTVTERLNRVAGVVSASVSLSEKSALVYIQQEKTTAAHLIQAIERAGFEASLVTEKSINNKK